MTEEISGIDDFLTRAGTHYRVFDMGRRIQPLARDAFIAFENGTEPYPFPLQQHAWLGFLVWQDTADDDVVIWFIKFPLDARGHLSPQVRHDFLHHLLNRKDEADDKEHPFGFKPKQEHMAVFHARAACALNKPPSRFYTHAVEYLSGAAGYDQWAFVGFQGIADLVARLDEDNNRALLVNAFPQLPWPPVDAFCQCLEHETIDFEVTEVLAQRLQEELARDNPSVEHLSMLVRGLSGSSDTGTLRQALQQLLTRDISREAEILAAISGRCWAALQDPALMFRYLETLSHNLEGQALFNLVVSDLIAVPGMQGAIHEAIRNPDRSDQLSRSIGGLFQPAGE